MPGEESAKTQPFPTKPAPFSKQGFSADDVIDFTPGVKAAALAELAKYRPGPLYTPPSVEGTVVMPGVIGGAGWGGASVDVETGWIYVKATNQPALSAVAKRDAPSDTVDHAWAVNSGMRSLNVVMRDVNAAAGGGGRGLESSRVTTRIQNDFWAELRSSLVAIIGTGEGRNVVISPHSGVVVVRALPGELRGVEAYLRATRLAVERQVMLEAKIIDVELSDSYQSGINWALLPNRRLAAGQVGSETTLTTNTPLISRGLTAEPGVSLSTGAGAAALLAGSPGAALFGLALQVQNFSALLQFLETQGKVQVLSSPRVATLNNQKAVLKVGTDEFFVTNIQSATTVATAAGTTTGTPVPTVTVQPFFSGIVLDVTPQIDENNQIILHVHPSVSQVTTDNKDISLGAAGTLRLPLARSNVSETDTIVRVTDGNIVALGGLMKLDLRDNRGGMPGTGDNVIGNFLRNTSTQVVKKEMVILIKPTIILGDRSWDEDLAQTRNRIETLDAPAPGAQTATGAR